MDFTGEFHLRGASDEVVHGTGVHRVPFHVLSRVAHDGVTCSAGGHHIKTLGFSQRKVASNQGILQFRRGLFDDVSTITAGTWNLNQLDVEGPAEGLNAIFHFCGTRTGNVSGVVCHLCHHFTSEPLVNFIEEADDLVVILNTAVEHLGNSS